MLRKREAIILKNYRKTKCLYCTNEIENNKDWVVFCSSKCEHAFHRENKEFCYYCGLPPQIQGRSKEIIQACKECHSILINFFSCCAAGEAKILLNRYQEKYKKLLNLIDWNEEELQDMGKNMRTKIKSSLYQKYTAEARISWLQYSSRMHSCSLGDLASVKNKNLPEESLTQQKPS